MADIEQSRANFEKWARDRGMPVHRRDFPESERHGQYGNVYTQEAWEAVRAALASQPQPVGDLLPELQREVAALRQRAIRAHQICNLARVTYPQIGELDDDGCLHEAIHDILRVPMSGSQPQAPAAAAHNQLSAQHHDALQRIGTALGLPAGSNLQTECVPAIEALRAAADRYRYLREEGDGFTITVRGFDDDGDEDWVSGYALEDLDAAIDAAMLAAAPAPEVSNG